MKSASPHAALIGAASQKLRGGQASEAYALLQSALKQAPRDADALALAAGAARQLGRAEEAVALFRRAVAERPKFAPLHNSLGAALKAAGDIPGARLAFERAATLQPDLFDATFNLGLLLSEQDAYEPAIAALQRAIALDPRRAEAHEALGNALVRAGEPAQGLSALKQAAVLKPGGASIAHNIAIAQEALGDDAAALASFRQAVQLAPSQAVSWFAIGNVERRLGHQTAAGEAYRKTIELAPNHLDAHTAFTDTSWEAGDQQGHLTSYPYAIQRLPNDAGLRRAFAERLARVRHYEEAEQQARAALAIESENVVGHDVLGKSLFGAQRYEDAAESFRRAVALAPGEVAIWGRYAETLMRVDKLGHAHDALKRALELAPLDQENLARLSIVLRLLGEEGAYTSLVDYDALTRAIAVRPPEGFADIESFNRVLAPYLQAKHLTKQHPTDQTLRGGTQTLGSLFADPHPLVQGLRQSLYDAVEEFVAALPEDKAHPFFGRRGSGLKFSGSWSVRLGCGGFHTNHIHPAGWISSAYYVSLPPEVANEESRQGWLKMGETNPDTSPDLPAERWVQPEEGKLVLFPSYVWHGTQAFDEGDQRLTVAFDVIPTSD